MSEEFINIVLKNSFYIHIHSSWLIPLQIQPNISEIFNRFSVTELFCSLTDGVCYISAYKSDELWLIFSFEEFQIISKIPKKEYSSC